MTFQKQEWMTVTLTLTPGLTFISHSKHFKITFQKDIVNGEFEYIVYVNACDYYTAQCFKMI
jgi:hypothetical protein